MAKRSLLRREIRELRRDLRAADLDSNNQRFKAVDRNTDLATADLKGRLDLLNELRGNVVSREEFHSEIKALETKIDLNTDALNASRGGGRALDKAWGYLVGALGVVIVGIDVILRATGH
jgi:hypothetical protein